MCGVRCVVSMPVRRAARKNLSCARKARLRECARVVRMERREGGVRGGGESAGEATNGEDVEGDRKSDHHKESAQHTSALSSGGGARACPWAHAPQNHIYIMACAHGARHAITIDARAGSALSGRHVSMRLASNRT